MSGYVFFERAWQVCSNLWNGGDNLEVANVWHDRVVEKYSAKSRRYHTMQHVESMLAECQEHAVVNQELVSLACVFHDVVYDPKRKDNEELSAEMFKSFAVDIGIGSPEKDVVVDYILCTERHTTAAFDPHKYGGLGNPMDLLNDLRIFLDLDLAILASNDQQYDTYARLIREEYAHVPDADYRKGRCTVLKHLSQDEHVYFSEQFRSKGRDDAARCNIAREMRSLSYEQ